MADPELDRETLRRRLLGWSLACPPTPAGDLGRDLQLGSGPGGLDLARVAGIDNLGQSLAVALTTLLGSDVFNTSFGFSGLQAMVEETRPALVRERLRAAVIRVLQAEPRVGQIVDVALDGGAPGDSSADPRELAIRVVFETVSGDQAVVDLGKVVPGA